MALGAGALAGVLLTSLGAAAIPLAWGAGGLAAAGLIGRLSLRRAGAAPRLALTALWAWAAVGALVAGGGLTGVYAPFVLAPLIAAAALGEALLVGVLMTALAVLAGQWIWFSLGETGAGVLEDPARVWITLTAVVATALAALLAVRRRTVPLASAPAASAGLQTMRAPAVRDDADLIERLAQAERERDQALAARQAAEVSLQAAEEGRRAARAVLQVTVDGREAAEAKVREAESARDTAHSSARAELDEARAALAAAEALRREAEQGRAAAEAQAAARVRFLANMSHELRTPLNAIMGFSDIMKQRLFGPLSDKYAEYSELIHDSGRHLLELINDVLDLAKVEAGRYELVHERFDGREPVQAAVRLLRRQAEEASLSLRAVLPSVAVEVDADRRAVKQMVINLLANALKFTPPGGEVTVIAGPRDQAYEIAVSDTGIGIGEEDIARLGRPFEQAGDSDARPQGTGLGLSLVKAMAALHGGEMVIESRLGQGTAVTLSLPVLANAPAMGAAIGSLDAQADASEETGRVIPLAR